MATATNFQLKNNTAKQRRGLVEEITAVSLVVGLTATDADWVTEALAATNLPAAGTVLILSTGEKLYLENRDPKLVDGDNTKAEVALTYRRLDGSSSTENQVPVLSGGVALKQVRTSKDRNGNAIEVSHSWPEDSKAVYPDGQRKRLTTETITAQIDVFVPMASLSGEIVIQTATPGAISKAWVGYLNSTTWQGGEARTWMCTAAPFRLLDNTSSPPLWTFNFEFQQDDQTWDNDTTAVFIDPQTGQIPQIAAADLPLPNGKEVVQVQYYPTRDFNVDF